LGNTNQFFYRYPFVGGVSAVGVWAVGEYGDVGLSGIAVAIVYKGFVAKGEGLASDDLVGILKG
jgi:hypothetical protein